MIILSVHHMVDLAILVADYTILSSRNRTLLVFDGTVLLYSLFLSSFCSVYFSNTTCTVFVIKGNAWLNSQLT